MGNPFEKATEQSTKAKKEPVFEKHDDGRKPEFFDMSEQEVAKKYSKPADEFQRKRGLKKEYDTWKITKELTKRFDEFLVKNNNQIPDSFFQEVVEMAKKYKAAEIGHCEQFEKTDGALMFSQLFALIRHPEFIKDPRSVKVMEELSDLENAEPWDFNMYVDYKKEKGYELRKGFGIEQLPNFQNLIDNPNLWQGKSKEMRRVFFASVAEAIEKIATKNPEETLPLRLKLLEYNLDYGSGSELMMNLVYSFKSDKEKEALQKIIKERPASKIAKEAKKILEDEYEDVAWA